MSKSSRNITCSLGLALVSVFALAATCDDDSDPCKTATPTVTAATPDSGFNLKTNAVTLTGTCFDKDTTAVLVDAAGTAHPLTEITFTDAGHLAATVPAGLAVGKYGLKVTRTTGSAVKDNAYAAVSNILASNWAMNEGIRIADVRDLANPALAVHVSPQARTAGWDHGSVTVNYTGLRVYWSEADGIFGCDILSCGQPTKLASTDADIDNYHGHVAASPAGPWIVFDGHITGGGSGANSIFVIKEDGTGLKRVAHMDEFHTLPNNDTLDSWSEGQAVFSPDGSKIAYLTEGHCGAAEGAPPALCLSDFYEVVMTMNSDGTGKTVAHYEEGSFFYNYLHWTKTNKLVWSKADSDKLPAYFVALPAGGGTLQTITHPTGQWPDFGWMAYSPLDDAFILQPHNTNDMVHYAFTAGASGMTAGAGTPVKIPNPDVAGEFLPFPWIYWFGWMP
jgi:hypothetical protein